MPVLSFPPGLFFICVLVSQVSSQSHPYISYDDAYTTRPNYDYDDDDYDDDYDSSEEESGISSGKKAGIIVGSLFAVFVIVGAGVFAYFRCNRGKREVHCFSKETSKSTGAGSTTGGSKSDTSGREEPEFAVEKSNALYDSIFHPEKQPVPRASTGPQEEQVSGTTEAVECTCCGV